MCRGITECLMKIQVLEIGPRPTASADLRAEPGNLHLKLQVIWIILHSTV